MDRGANNLIAFNFFKDFCSKSQIILGGQKSKGRFGLASTVRLVTNGWAPKHYFLVSICGGANFRMKQL